MFEAPDIPIRVQIEHAIAGEIDKIFPLPLIRRSIPGSFVLDGIRKIDVLTDLPMLRDRQRRHLQIGRGRERNRQCARKQIVPFVFEFLNSASGRTHPRIHLPACIAGPGVGNRVKLVVGLKQQVIAALDRIRQAHVHGARITRACLQNAVGGIVSGAGQRAIGRVERRIARQEQEIRPFGHARRTRTQVGDRVRDLNRFAGARRWIRDGQVRDLQVRFAVSDVDVALPDIVVAAQVLKHTVRVERSRAVVVRRRFLALCGQLVIGLGVGDHIDVVVAVVTRRHRDIETFGVRTAGAEPRGVAVSLSAEIRGTIRIERGIFRNPDRIQPILRPGPYRRAVIARRPSDPRLLTGKY